MPASLHIGDGFARIGGVTLPARASARGLELGGDAVLCPVSFGLRSRLVAWISDDLGEALLAEMLDGVAEGLEPLALQALALHLAGAESGAPGFAASAALVARLLGWSLTDINAAEALEIDRLAASLAPAMEHADDGGWTTVLFMRAEDAGADDEPLEAICTRLSADLQRRSGEVISRSQAAVLSAAPPATQVTAQAFAAPDNSGRGFGNLDQTAVTAGHAITEQTTGAAAKLDPPPDPWRDQEVSASEQPDFGALPSAATPVARFAQPLPERGAGAAVWAQPEVDGNPALAYQSEQAPAAEGQGHQKAAASSSSAASAVMGVLAQADTARDTDTVAFPTTATRQGRLEAFARPDSLQTGQAVTAFPLASAPTRSDLFGYAVAQPHQASGQPTPNAAPPMSQPHPLSMTQGAIDAALDLDAIADALHAIADLRGIAR